MNPPKVYEVASPKSHKTSRTTKIVQSMLILSCTRLELRSLVRRTRSWGVACRRGLLLFPLGSIPEIRTDICSLMNTFAVWLQIRAACKDEAEPAWPRARRRAVRSEPIVPRAEAGPSARGIAPATVQLRERGRQTSWVRGPQNRTGNRLPGSESRHWNRRAPQYPRA